LLSGPKKIFRHGVTRTSQPPNAGAGRLGRRLLPQQANEWDLSGHAQKAKNLLDQVNDELKLAAETANRR
jgi:hypothetical protein